MALDVLQSKPSPELRQGHKHKLVLPQPSIDTDLSPALELLSPLNTTDGASFTGKARRQLHISPTRMKRSFSPLTAENA